MKYVLHYDYAAILVYMVLLLAIFFRKLYREKTSRILTYLVVISLLATAFDIWSIKLNLLDPHHEILKYVINILCIFFSNIMTPMYVCYILSLTELDRRRRVAFWIHGTVPIVLLILGLLTNYWTRWIFYIDADGLYQRGVFFWLLYVGVGYYALFNIVHLSRTYRLLGVKNTFALSCFLLFILGSIGMQFLFPEQLIQLFAVSLSLVLIMLIIHRPEAFLDEDTEAQNSSAFLRKLENVSFFNYEVDVIIINIRNYMTFVDMLGLRKSIALMKKLTEELERIREEERIPYTLYYLRRGRFRIVVERQNMTRRLALIVSRHMFKSFVYEEMSLQYNACICVANYPKDAADPDALEVLADNISPNIADGEVHYAKDMLSQKHVKITRQMDSIIQNALNNHYFEVYYQPIYDVASKRFRSAEALLRLKDPEFGFIPPDVFIPAAEKSGAIHAIGAFVLEEVCAFIAGKEFEDLGMNYIEINLSVVQCMRRKLADEVQDILTRYNVDVNKINLEITETAASYSQNTFMENISQLSDRGINFSLDDYGTGYSNIERIASMPFQIVKFDKTFTNTQTDRMNVILENTVHMFKSMNLEIVVEGVETLEMLERFVNMGCDYIQGYYFSKPLPKADFVRFVLEKNESR